MYSVFFFGSFQDYSTKIAQSLLDDPDITLMGIATTPPSPAGRDKKITKTHTHLWAQKHNLPVFTPDKLDRQDLAFLESTLDPLFKSTDPTKKRIDFIITAGYRQLLPQHFLDYPKLAPLNLHASLLPAYRGVRPAEFAILMDEIETGMTVIQMVDQFDLGPIIAQQKIKIDQTNSQLDQRDTRQTLYKKLYETGANIIVETVKNWESVHKFAKKQPQESTTPYARKLTKQDGFIDWQTLTQAMKGEEINIPMHLHKTYQLPTTVESIERTHRALYSYPGIWTQVETKKGKKRLKILAVSISHLKDHRPRLQLETVQLEGSTPSTFNQIKNQIIS